MSSLACRTAASIASVERVATVCPSCGVGCAIDLVYHPDRLRFPLLRKNGRLGRIFGTNSVDGSLEAVVLFVVRILVIFLPIVIVRGTHARLRIDRALKLHWGRLPLIAASRSFSPWWGGSP